MMGINTGWDELQPRNQANVKISDLSIRYSSFKLWVKDHDHVTSLDLLITFKHTMLHLQGLWFSR